MQGGGRPLRTREGESAIRHVYPRGWHKIQTDGFPSRAADSRGMADLTCEPGGLQNRVKNVGAARDIVWAWSGARGRTAGVLLVFAG